MVATAELEIPGSITRSAEILRCWKAFARKPDYQKDILKNYKVTSEAFGPFKFLHQFRLPITPLGKEEMVIVGDVSTRVWE